jgi:hypothetical protein
MRLTRRSSYIPTWENEAYSCIKWSENTLTWGKCPDAGKKDNQGKNVHFPYGDLGCFSCAQEERFRSPHGKMKHISASDGGKTIDEGKRDNQEKMCTSHMGI